MGPCSTWWQPPAEALDAAVESSGVGVQWLVLRCFCFLSDVWMAGLDDCATEIHGGTWWDVSDHDAARTDPAPSADGYRAHDTGASADLDVVLDCRTVGGSAAVSQRHALSENDVGPDPRVRVDDDTDAMP